MTLTGWWGTVLDSSDAPALGRFYADLLGWELDVEGSGWATAKAADAKVYLGFQTSAEYVRPVWPPAEGQQQMMLHLDFGVDDLDAAVASAEKAGATLAGFQPQQTVRIMLDPDGHPFCLYLDN